MSDGSHADGVQISAGANIVIRGNFFDMPVKVDGTNSNAAIFAKEDFGQIDNVLIERNWMNGGNYTLFITTKDGDPCTNVVVRDNLFGRDYRYGAKTIKGDTNIWENNRWWDTLTLI
jgi:polygalacturonase